MRRLTTILTLFIYCCVYGQVTRQKTSLILSGQHLKRIPDSVFSNTQLTYLDLGSRVVTFYPPLSALLASDSNANHISRLPAKIGKLTNLQTLILNSNNLTTLPSSIFKLTKLEVIDLSINNNLDIVKELDKINQLPSLKVLKLVDVKPAAEDIDKLKQTLRPGIRIVLTIPEYMDSLK